VSDRRPPRCVERANDRQATKRFAANGVNSMILTILQVSAVVIVLVICLVSARRRQTEFLERFPPMSDAEFVARCSSGTSPEIALKVRRIVADALSVDYERIHPSSRFVEDLEC
jgi:hypothetical protein